jgi:predicted branched-subunit amino acid permease
MVQGSVTPSQVNTGPVKKAILETLTLFLPAIPFALVFGLVVVESGLPALLGWSTSPLMFSGAAQITLVTLLGEGASFAAAATAALIVGARHLFYSITLAPRFQGQPAWFRWLGPYLLIDQVFALTVTLDNRDPDYFRRYYLASGFSFWTLWMSFTALGLFIGPVIPESWGLAFATPVLFLGLLALSVDRWEKVVVAVAAMLITFALADMPNRSGMLVAAFLSILLGLLLERVRR